jgi:peptidyl-prolyl cis-trans isomerase B (cyclophilin B)
MRVLAVAVLAASVLAGAAFVWARSSESAQPKQWDKPPEMKIDVAKKYTATITTDRGEIVLDLYAREAPVTVNNFVFLAREGFYNGVTFHRVINPFMIQGGDPTGTGRGGPGYRFEDEVDPAKNPHKFDGPGVLAMANAGPATNGSQFFITHVETPHLTGKHTIFGKVVKGMDIVNATKQGDVMKSVTIKEE